MPCRSPAGTGGRRRRSSASRRRAAWRPLPGRSAGLPSDRAEVATLLDGDWQNFFDVGRQYQQATGKAWFDQSGFLWNAMVNQLEEGYYTKDGELNVEGNTEMRARWDSLAAATADGLSAAQSTWDWNGGQSFVDGTFATFVCPGWMLGVVKGQIEAGGGDAPTGWTSLTSSPVARPTGAARSSPSRR